MRWRALKRPLCWLIRHRWDEGAPSGIPPGVAGWSWVWHCRRCTKNRLGVKQKS